MLVHVTDSQIRSWRLRGFKLEHIARVCGTTISRISHRIQQIWQHDQQRAEYFGDRTSRRFASAASRSRRPGPTGNA
jgi:hypothetical protein